MKVILIMAITLDGKIARNAQHFPNWTGSEDKKFFRKKTTEIGCVIMGNTTFQTLSKPLPNRQNFVMTQQDNLIDSREDVRFVTGSPVKILQEIKEAGFDKVALIGGSKTNTFFAQENLINEIYLTIYPKIFGTGIELFESELDEDFTLISSQSLNDGAMVLHYQKANMKNGIS